MFTYSVTFDVVTPESAEQGDFAETGFVKESVEFDGSVETAAALVRDHCGCAESCSGPLTAGDWFTAADPEVDYTDGSEYRESVHFDGVSDAWMRSLEAELAVRGLI